MGLPETGCICDKLMLWVHTLLFGAFSAREERLLDPPKRRPASLARSESTSGSGLGAGLEDALLADGAAAGAPANQILEI